MFPLPADVCRDKSALLTTPANSWLQLCSEPKISFKRSKSCFFYWESHFILDYTLLFIALFFALFDRFCYWALNAAATLISCFLICTDVEVLPFQWYVLFVLVDFTSNSMTWGCCVQSFCCLLEEKFQYLALAEKHTRWEIFCVLEKVGQCSAVCA